MSLHNVHKNREIYGNCQVLSPDDILMFKCELKKAHWYINRNLGYIIQEDPLIVKLKFKPKGLGNHNKEFGLSEMINQCVSCLSKEHLTRHHVVPFCYKKYFPLELKSHKHHDILPLCINCHDTYERYADILKKELSIKYMANLNNIQDQNKDLFKLSKLASTLLGDISKIPLNRIIDIKSEIKDYFDIERLTNSKLNEIAGYRFKSNKIQGEIVVRCIADIQSFVEMWRKHFIDNIKCSYLPKNWNINTSIYK